MLLYFPTIVLLPPLFHIGIHAATSIYDPVVALLLWPSLFRSPLSCYGCRSRCSHCFALDVTLVVVVDRSSIVTVTIFGILL